MEIGLVLLMAVLLSTVVYSQKVPVDSLKVDTTTIADTVVDAIVAEPAEPLTILLKATALSDSLLKLLPLHSQIKSPHLDFAQISSRFDYDPMLMRISQGPWGEGEQFYPLGLAPGSMSRADPLFGDAALSNPVPAPLSEEAMRIDPSQEYYFLSPALAGALVPFSRATALYQPLPEPPGDSAHSKLYVRRGRFGYANTEITFANQLGNLGSVNLDANFIKLDNQLQFLKTKNDRARLILTPNIGVNHDLQVGMFLSRTHADRPFLPGFYFSEGRVTDNYSGLAAAYSHTRSDLHTWGCYARYRNDDQAFESSDLNHQQRYWLLETGAFEQLTTGRHTLRYDVDARLINYEAGDASAQIGYRRIAGSDMLRLDSSLTLYGQFGIVWANDLDVQPTLTAMLHYDIDKQSSAAIILSRQAVLPTMDQKYLPAIVEGIAFGEDDYLISGNRDLQGGTSNSVEVLGSTSLKRLDLRLRGGITRFKDAPFWMNDRSEHINAGYQPQAFDLTLLYGSVNAYLPLPYGTFTSVAYGARQASDSGVNYTYAPEHELDGLSGIKFWVEHFQVTITAAVGGKFRSAPIRYLDGGVDNEKFVAESFLSVDLKRFHFFWNYTNLFDTIYSVNGRRQPGRSHWWGFSWEFFD